MGKGAIVNERKELLEMGKGTVGGAGRKSLRKRSYRISVRKMETLSNKNIKMIANWCSKKCKYNGCDYKYYLYLCIKKYSTALSHKGSMLGIIKKLAQNKSDIS